MASRTIRGLTVEIGGDTRKLSDAIKSAEKQMTQMRNELKDVNKLLSFDPSNTDALRHKTELLSKAIEACGDKLKELNEFEKAMARMPNRTEKQEEQYRALQREIMETESKMGNYKRQLKGTEEALDKLGDETKDTKVDMSSLSDAVERAGGGFTVFKGAVADLLAEGLRELAECLKEVAKYMVQTGMAFDQSMSKVEALIDPSERTAENMEALTQKAMEMGAKTKFSAGESADAMTHLAQAGWTAQEMLAGIDGVMNLAATDGIELATAAEITSDALNALGYEAGDASRFADVLAVSAAASSTNVEEMGYAFQYAGPLAGALGYSMEDLAVALGTMANAGIKGEKAGTSLRSLFTNMAKPTDAMATAMEKYGISLTDAQGNMLPLQDVLYKLRDTFDGLSEAEKTSLAATLANKTGMSGLLAIVNSSDEEFNQMTASINDSKGAAEEMATVMQDNLAGDVEKLGGAFDTLSIALTDKFNEPMREAVQAVTAFLDGEATMTETLNRLGGAFSQAFETFKTFLPQLGQMGSEFLNWIVNGIVTGLPGLLSTGGQIVMNLLSGIASMIPNVMQTAVDVFHDFTLGLQMNLPLILEQGRQILMNLVTGIANNLPSLVSQALDSIMRFATTLYDNAPTLIQTGFDMLSKLVQGILNCLPTLLSKVPEIISKFANIINHNFPTILKKGFELLWQIIKGILSAIPDLIKNIPKIITAIVDVWEAFNWLSLGKKCIDLLGKGIKGMWTWMKNIGKQTVDVTVSFLKNLPQNLLNLGKQAITFLGNAFRNGWSTVRSAASTIFQGIVNYFKGLPTKMLSLGKDIIKGLFNGIKGAATWLWEQISGFGGSIISAFKSVFGIKSPSRVFRDEIGKNIGLGLAEGIENSEGAVEAAMGGLSDTVMGTSFDGLALERDLQHRGAQIAATVTAQTDSSMLGKLDKILSAIEKGQVISLDGRQLVGGTAAMYDAALGQRRLLAARGAI